MMTVFGCIECRIIRYLCRKRAAKVSHRFRKVRSIAHLVSYVVQLRSESEPSQAFDRPIQILYGTCRRRHDAKDAVGLIEHLDFKISKGRTEVDENELVAALTQDCEDVERLSCVEHPRRPLRRQAFRQAKQDLQPRRPVRPQVIQDGSWLI